MRSTKQWLCVLILTLLAAPGFADHNGKSHGKPGGGGDGGGSTDDNSGHAPVTFTFRDCQDGFPSAAYASLHTDATADPCAGTPDDRLRSDIGVSYERGVDDVDAYVGTKGTAGNFWLKVAPSPRTLFVDFSDCTSAPAECNPPFSSGQIDRAAIYVQISAVRKNGAFGMVIGETILVPMRIYFEIVAGQMNFLDFNPNLAGNDPCKGKGNYIEVQRTGENTWEVYGNTIGCMSQQNGFSGNYRMPFGFTVVKK